MPCIPSQVWAFSCWTWTHHRRHQHQHQHQHPSTPPPPPPPPSPLRSPGLTARFFLLSPRAASQTVSSAAAAMPTVSVGRDRLFAALGRTYSKFDFLCSVPPPKTPALFPSATARRNQSYWLLSSAGGVRGALLRVRHRAGRCGEHISPPFPSPSLLPVRYAGGWWEWRCLNFEGFWGCV